jgi:hypothetical protein
MEHSRKRINVLQKEFEYIEQGRCWISTKVPSQNGYPYTRIQNRQTTIARVIFAHLNHPIEKGQVLRHTCDQKKCINPKHMLLGSVSDNVRDAVKRGLNPKEETHGMAKLRFSDIQAIRTLSANGFAGSYIAKLFGISKSSVSKILQGKHWIVSSPSRPGQLG